MSDRALGSRVGQKLAISAAALVVLSAVPASLVARGLQAPQPPAAPDAQRAERAQADARCSEASKEYQQTRYAAAREPALQCAALYEQLGVASGVGRANQLLSMIAERSGERAEAESRARRAVAAYEATDDLRGRATATLQFVRVAPLGHDEVIRLLRGVIADVREIGDRSIEARALHSLGDHLFTAASYEEAFDALTQTAAAFEAIGDRRSLGRAYNSLGRLYRAHERSDEALKFQLAALAIHETTDSPFELLQSLNAVAVTHQTLGNSESARVYFERALALAERTSSQRIQDFLRANLVSTQIERGAYAEAAAILEGVLARGLDAYPNLRMRDLSRTYLKLGRRDDAMRMAEKAFGTCATREVDCLYAMDLRAEINAALGRRDAALADIGGALEKIEAIRARLVPADFFKQQFSAAQEAIYSRAIALQLGQRRAAEALATAELARSRAFVDLLASKALQPRDPSPASGPDRLPLTFRGPPAAGARADLPSGVAAPAATANDLAQTARRLGSTLLAYWVTADRLFIWVIDAQGTMHDASVDVRESRLAELIRATAPFPEPAPAGPTRPAPPTLTTRGAAAIALEKHSAAAWRQLYDLVVKPVRGVLPRQPGALVTIVPHGPLAALSFAALQDARGRYLLEDYTLHYVPAGAVLDFTASRRHPQSRTGDVLLVADPVPPVISKLDAPLPRLAGARAEARAIARLIPAARVTALNGEHATKQAIRTATTGKAILHFATHAIVQDEDPFGSYLAVTPTPGTPGSAASDGLLTAREIYELNLDADLVVLSACRSAGGRVRGDGIATFARAFIYAGTPSLIASVWDVADQPANRLLPDFYRTWLGGASKARALRGAQLRLLRELRAGRLQVETPLGKIRLPEHPVFWAGFALFGEPD